MENSNLFFIAITGCIGSGKTTVSNFLIQEGFTVISGDELSRQYLNHPEVIQKLQEIIRPKEVVKTGHIIDLKWIGSYFDKHPDDEILFEQWFQPFLGKQIRAEAENYKGQILFWDIPYLKQKCIEDIFDVIWVIRADRECCEFRIRKRNHYTNSKINFLIKLSSVGNYFNNAIIINNNSDIHSLFSNVKIALQHTIFTYYSQRLFSMSVNKYCNTTRCPDITAGMGGVFWFEENKRCHHKQELSIDTDNKITTIVIILESPHKSEFIRKNSASDFFDSEIHSSPALGVTGSNLQKYFTDEYLRSVIPNLPQKYRVILMNSIQYQCSLGLSPNKCRDHMWLSLWFGSNGIIQDSFVTRLQSYNPDYIFNLCTVGNHSEEILPKGLKAKTVINPEYIKFCLENTISITADIPEMNRYTIRSIVTSLIKNMMSQLCFKKTIVFEGTHPSNWRKNLSLNDLIYPI